MASHRKLKVCANSDYRTTHYHHCLKGDKMFKKFIAGAALVAALATSSVHSAQAAALSGSLPLAGFLVSQNSTDLLLSTTVSSVFTFTSGLGIGDYSPIPVATDFGPTLLDFSSTAAMTGFTMSNAGYGTWTTTSGAFAPGHTASFLQVLLHGTFTPSGALSSFDPTPATLRISVNLSGGSLAEAITLDSTKHDVPEPGSIAMLVGMGVSGGFLALRRRRK